MPRKYVVIWILAAVMISSSNVKAQPSTGSSSPSTTKPTPTPKTSAPLVQSQPSTGSNSGSTPKPPAASSTSTVAPQTSTAKQQGEQQNVAQDDKFNIPNSANEKWRDTCVDKSLNLNGDFQTSESFMFIANGQWSVGPSVSTQLVKYDMAKKQAGFNTSVGAGASFRFYRDIPIRGKDGETIETVKISEVKRECRQSSWGSRQSYMAAPMFSITPTLYATKPTDSGDLAVQPALLVGFFEDILNFGVGFNLTGPPGEKGHVFLLMSIGTGFSF